MAKKRKARRDPADVPAPKNAKFDVEERFDDSEDEFFAAKDKVLLDNGPAAKRRQRLSEQEAELQPSDEEIMAYEDSELDEDDDEEADLDEQPHVSSPKRKRQGGSDEEDDEQSEEEGWGTNRADYYNADVIGTEADALEEEAEAKRLQQKQLKAMADADFGFDEATWGDIVEEKNEKTKATVVEKLPDAEIPENATVQQQIRILEARYPEFRPLADDFATLSEELKQLREESKAAETQLSQGYTWEKGLAVTTKRDILSTYLGTVAMYFAVVSSTSDKNSNSRKITAVAPLQLREHPIIQQLTRARQLWEAVKDEDSAELVPAKIVDVLANGKTPKTKNIKTKEKKTQPGTTKKSKTSKKRASSPSSESDFSGLDGLDDLDGLAPLPSSKKKSKPKKPKAVTIDDLLATTNGAGADSDDDSLHADETPLTAEELATKAQKRKSLRFYTSQIAQKANKRGAKSREAGGDDDIPHKERTRDKTERLMREAEARGRGGDLEADDDDDYDELPNSKRTTGEEDEYIDLLSKNASKRKEDKAARAEAFAQAAAQNAAVYETETVGEDGKRKITYAIEKNKGLMPKRKKDVRNPRVKKRKKFDEKMKKLGSVRQVYKGGEGRGGYKGELTGIKSGVVRSVKL